MTQTNKQKSILCYIFFVIIIIILTPIAYDCIHVSQLKKNVLGLKIGDSKKVVTSKLGEPSAVMPIGTKSFFSVSSEECYAFYGSMFDWDDAFSKDFPYFFPFKFRLFGPYGDDIKIFFNKSGCISSIHSK